VLELALEVLHRNRRQHLPDEKRGQPRRPLSYHRDEADLWVRLLERLHSAKALNVLGVFLDERIDDVVDRDDALDHSIVVDHWNGDEIVLTRDARDLLAIRVDRDRLHLFPRYVRYLPTFRRGEKLAQRHDALDAAGCVSRVDGVHRFAPLGSRDATNRGECFFDRRVLGDGDELRRHQSAGGIGLVGEKLFGFGALRRRNFGENLLRRLFLETFERIGPVVRSHLRDELGRLPRAHRLENFGAQILVQVLEDIGSALDRQRGQERRDHLARQRFGHGRQILGVQLLSFGGDRLRSLLEHDEDVRHEKSGQRPLFVHLNLRIVGRGLHGASGSVGRLFMVSITS